MRDCRSGGIDVVVVSKFDRFARSLRALIGALDTFKALGIDFVSVTESIDTALPAGELVFHIFGAVAQFERALIGQRVKSGLEHARKRGVLLGRPPLRRLSPQEVAELREERMLQKCHSDNLLKNSGSQFGRLTGFVHPALESPGFSNPVHYWRRVGRRAGNG